MEIKLDVNADETMRALTAVLGQVPFAMSRAINGVLYDAEADLRGHLTDHFTVRRSTFLQQSIIVTPAKKDYLVGELAVPPRPRSGIAQGLALQEAGGTKQPLGGGLAEPLSGARPTPTAVTPPSKWPGAIRNRSFTITDKRGNLLVLQRTGPKSRRRGRKLGPILREGDRRNDPNVQVMWEIVKQEPIAPRWNFYATAKSYVARFNTYFAREWANAIKTARR